ncbi:MAG: zinc ribbon domain-containing protein [Sedimentisphaerales bacterium]|nr:zinc ribbon domain-containing protein [Sedimentisphaerales bacterium]
MGLFEVHGFPGKGESIDVGAAHAASRAEGKARSVESQLGRLRDSLAKAMMINEALWEMIRDQHGLTEKDLYQKLYEIDMRDGVLDGKNQRKPAPCPNCGRMVSARHTTCLYCGQTMDTSVFTVD